MDGVENSIYSGPVIVGIGTRAQEGALLTAGAEKVFDWDDMRDMLMQTAGSSIRAGDTVLMVQPLLMKVADLRALMAACGGDLLLQVPGHKATSDEDVFRKQKPKGAEAIIQPTTGRPPKITYTIEQADAIIRSWHAIPRKTRIEVARDADRILGLPDGSIKPEWVRDLAIKFVGTAKRDRPDDWNGISTGTE